MGKKKVKISKKTKAKKSASMKKYWSKKKKPKSKKKNAKKLTWSQFMKGKMSPYMKSEGSHAGAMKRLSKEWKVYNKKSK